MTIKNALAIPKELRDLNQWVLWKMEDKGGIKPTKVPYSIAHKLASVIDPSTWSSFEQTFNTFQSGGYDGLGFVFTDNDPFAFIDLDNTCGDQVALERQQKVFKEFNSYSEVSPSGKGLHIIVKGSLPQGRRRSSIEIYSSQRYATMTGNVYHTVSIADRHELLNELFKQMGGKPSVVSYTGDEKETQSDEQIINQASSATNGTKFVELLSGNWNNYYTSQSEADFAFIDIIAFYTQNRIQIQRIFRASALGQRKKAQRKDYLEWMINKSFDRLAPPLDFDGFRIALEEKIAASSNSRTTAFDAVNDGANPSAVTNGSVAQRLEPSAHNGLVVGSNPTASTILPPPGLIGEIAQFIYTAAPRPVPEIAIAGAIGLLSGICGKSYNVSGTGLNQYTLVLAMTGAGKEAAASGIDKLINEVSMQVPVANEFIGPSEIASGQALIKFISKKSQSFVSILGEFGKRLEMMCSERSNGAEKALNKTLLQLYNKSGKNDILRPSIFADSEKNTFNVAAPAFSILAESTPETFYNALTDNMLTDGLLPRFTIIEYTGKRPPYNEHHLSVKPSSNLIDKLATLVAHSKTLMHNRSVINVEADDDAAQLLKDFDKLSDKKINSTDKDAIAQLWNRAHIKLMKLSALVAIGINPFNPVITSEHVLWARQIINNDIKALSSKFERGEIGRNSDEIKQVNDMKKVISIYLKSEWEKIKGYGVDQRMYGEKIVPHMYLNKRLSSVASYKNDTRAKASVHINNVIRIMIEGGVLIEAPKKQLLDKFGTTMRAFVVSNINEFI